MDHWPPSLSSPAMQNYKTNSAKLLAFCELSFWNCSVRGGICGVVTARATLLNTPPSRVSRAPCVARPCPRLQFRAEWRLHVERFTGETRLHIEPVGRIA